MPPEEIWHHQRRVSDWHEMVAARMKLGPDAEPIEDVEPYDPKSMMSNDDPLIAQLRSKD